MKARRVKARILYDSQEIGLSDRVTSISYTDNDSGKSDEITLVFEDQDALWLRDDFIPEKEHDLDVVLYFVDWKREGDLIPYHCGNFTIDDITYSGSPNQCTIKGVSIPADSGFSTERRSKIWSKVTLRQIAEEIKNRYGMTDLFFWGAEPVIEKVEQSQKSDSEFIKELCEQQGMFLKIYKKALVIFDKVQYEARGIYREFRETDFEAGYTWNTTLKGTYTGAMISYTNPDKKNKVPIEVQVGDAKRLLRINEKADSEGEAFRIAKARVNAENEKAVTISFKAMGDAGLFASYNIDIVDMGRMSGKYFVKQVTHKVNGSGGHSMSVTGYRIFERL